MTPRIRALIAGLLAGLLYGLALRFMGQEIDSQAYLGIMSIAFLFVGPLAIGAISVQDKNQSLLLSFFWPAVPITLGCLVTLALKWEGLICILMYLPVGIIFAGIGGIVGRQLLRRNQRKAVLVLLFMPF